MEIEGCGSGNLAVQSPATTAASAQGRVDSITGQIQSIAAEITSLAGIVATIQQALAILQQELGALRPPDASQFYKSERVEDGTDENGNTRYKTVQVFDSAAFNAEMSAYLAEVSRIQSEISTKESELRDAQQQLDNKQRELAEKQQELADAQAALQQALRDDAEAQLKAQQEYERQLAQIRDAQEAGLALEAAAQQARQDLDAAARVLDRMWDSATVAGGYDDAAADQLRADLLDWATPPVDGEEPSDSDQPPFALSAEAERALNELAKNFNDATDATGAAADTVDQLQQDAQQVLRDLGYDATAVQDELIPTGQRALQDAADYLPREYTVVSDDTLHGVAIAAGLVAQHGGDYQAAADAIMAANPQLVDPNLIIPGQTLLLPPAQSLSLQELVPVAAFGTVPDVAASGVAVDGETLVEAAGGLTQEQVAVMMQAWSEAGRTEDEISAALTAMGIDPAAATATDLQRVGLAQATGATTLLSEDRLDGTTNCLDLVGDELARLVESGVGLSDVEVLFLHDNRGGTEGDTGHVVLSQGGEIWDPYTGAQESSAYFSAHPEYTFSADTPLAHQLPDYPVGEPWVMGQATGEAVRQVLGLPAGSPERQAAIEAAGLGSVSNALFADLEPAGGGGLPALDDPNGNIAEAQATVERLSKYLRPGSPDFQVRLDELALAEQVLSIVQATGMDPDVVRAQMFGQHPATTVFWESIYTQQSLSEFVPGTTVANDLVAAMRDLAVPPGDADAFRRFIEDNADTLTALSAMWSYPEVLIGESIYGPENEAAYSNQIQALALPALEAIFGDADSIRVLAVEHGTMPGSVDLTSLGTTYEPEIAFAVTYGDDTQYFQFNPGRLFLGDPMFGADETAFSAQAFSQVAPNTDALYQIAQMRDLHPLEELLDRNPGVDFLSPDAWFELPAQVITDMVMVLPREQQVAYFTAFDQAYQTDPYQDFMGGVFYPLDPIAMDQVMTVVDPAENLALINVAGVEGLDIYRNILENPREYLTPMLNELVGDENIDAYLQNLDRVVDAVGNDWLYDTSLPDHVRESNLRFIIENALTIDPDSLALFGDYPSVYQLQHGIQQGFAADPLDEGFSIDASESVVLPPFLRNQLTFLEFNGRTFGPNDPSFNQLRQAMQQGHIHGQIHRPESLTYAELTELIDAGQVDPRAMIPEILWNSSWLAEVSIDDFTHGFTEEVAGTIIKVFHGDPLRPVNGFAEEALTYLARDLNNLENLDDPAAQAAVLMHALGISRGTTTMLEQGFQPMIANQGERFVRNYNHSLQVALDVTLTVGTFAFGGYGVQAAAKAGMGLLGQMAFGATYGGAFRAYGEGARNFAEQGGFWGAEPLDGVELLRHVVGGGLRGAAIGATLPAGQWLGGYSYGQYLQWGLSPSAATWASALTTGVAVTTGQYTTGEVSGWIMDPTRAPSSPEEWQDFFGGMAAAAASGVVINPMMLFGGAGATRSLAMTVAGRFAEGSQEVVQEFFQALGEATFAGEEDPLAYAAAHIEQNGAMIFATAMAIDVFTGGMGDFDTPSFQGNLYLDGIRAANPELALVMEVNARSDQFVARMRAQGADEDVIAQFQTAQQLYVQQLVAQMDSNIAQLPGLGEMSDAELSAHLAQVVASDPAFLLSEVESGRLYVQDQQTGLVRAVPVGETGELDSIELSFDDFQAAMAKVAPGEVVLGFAHAGGEQTLAGPNPSGSPNNPVGDWGSDGTLEAWVRAAAAQNPGGPLDVADGFAHYVAGLEAGGQALPFGNGFPSPESVDWTAFVPAQETVQLNAPTTQEVLSELDLSVTEQDPGGHWIRGTNSEGEDILLMINPQDQSVYGMRVVEGSVDPEGRVLVLDSEPGSDVQVFYHTGRGQQFVVPNEMEILPTTDGDFVVRMPGPNGQNITMTAAGAAQTALEQYQAAKTFSDDFLATVLRDPDATPAQRMAAFESWQESTTGPLQELYDLMSAAQVVAAASGPDMELEVTTINQLGLGRVDVTSVQNRQAIIFDILGPDGILSSLETRNMSDSLQDGAIDGVPNVLVGLLQLAAGTAYSTAPGNEGHVRTVLANAIVDQARADGPLDSDALVGLVMETVFTDIFTKGAVDPNIPIATVTFPDGTVAQTTGEFAAHFVGSGDPFLTAGFMLGTATHGIVSPELMAAATSLMPGVEYQPEWGEAVLAHHWSRFPSLQFASAGSPTIDYTALESAGLIPPGSAQRLSELATTSMDFYQTHMPWGETRTAEQMAGILTSEEAANLVAAYTTLPANALRQLFMDGQQFQDDLVKWGSIGQMNVGGDGNNELVVGRGVMDAVYGYAMEGMIQCLPVDSWFDPNTSAADVQAFFESMDAADRVGWVQQAFSDYAAANRLQLARVGVMFDPATASMAQIGPDQAGTPEYEHFVAALRQTWAPTREVDANTDPDTLMQLYWADDFNLHLFDQMSTTDTGLFQVSAGAFGVEGRAERAEGVWTLSRTAVGRPDIQADFLDAFTLAEEMAAEGRPLDTALLETYNRTAGGGGWMVPNAEGRVEPLLDQYHGQLEQDGQLTLDNLAEFYDRLNLNEPFLDGNKRASLLAVTHLLEAEGYPPPQFTEADQTLLAELRAEHSSPAEAMMAFFAATLPVVPPRRAELP